MYRRIISRRSTWLSLILAASAVAVGLAGCSSSNSSSAAAPPSSSSSSAAAPASSGASHGTVQIALLGFNTTPYALYSEKAADAAAKQYGATVTFFDGKSDPATQLAQVQNALASGKYQGFIFQALDGHGLEPLAAQASGQGIKTASVEYTLGAPTDQNTVQAANGVDTTIGVGTLAQVRYVVAEIEKACTAKAGKGKPCNVALQPGLLNFPPDVYRLSLFKQMLGSTGYITVTQMPPGQYYVQGAQGSTLNFFQNKPKVDVLYTFADQMVDGVLTGLKQVGLTPGKDVYIVSLGESKEAVALIQAGQVFGTVGLYPATEASLAVKYIVELVHGQSVPKVTDLYSVRPPVVDAAYLRAHPDFTADWSYRGLRVMVLRSASSGLTALATIPPG